ncbi:MAG: class I SAM-dependent methyltransferase, partial [Chitinispirillaceae bacterium]|nr:class I SAM-dependent methyltransferase [Chitinispirillaceae bacterium]
MVTDPQSRYTSPAGKEFTLAAGRFAGVNPSSHVLDMGCGYGEGACNLAYEMRCRIVACDSNPENIKIAQENAIKRGVSHLITFEHKDILEADYSETPFDLILAEGGVLSYLSRLRGLNLACKWLVPRGWFAFSDLIILDQKAPKEILDIYKNEYYSYETEDSYRKLISQTELEVQFMCLV